MIPPGEKRILCLSQDPKLVYHFGRVGAETVGAQQPPLAGVFSHLASGPIHAGLVKVTARYVLYRQQETKEAA